MTRGKAEGGSDERGRERKMGGTQIHLIMLSEVNGCTRWKSEDEATPLTSHSCLMAQWLGRMSSRREFSLPRMKLLLKLDGRCGGFAAV